MTWAALLLLSLLVPSKCAVGEGVDEENPIEQGSEVVTQMQQVGLDQELEGLGVEWSSNITETVEAVMEKYPEEEQEEVQALPEYEDPRDVVENASNLKEWLLQQQWRSFTSTIGKVGSRRVKDVAIQYVTVRGGGSKGAMIFSVGRSQNIRQYDEALYHFMNQGYDPIYIYAHRGQGESDRLLPDIDFPGHYVEKASDLVTDFRTFVGMAREETGDGVPLYVFCHSLGCGVTLTYVIEEYQKQRPQLLNAVVASAPYMQAVTKPFPYSVATGLARVLTRLGMGRKWAPTYKSTFEKNHGYMAFHNNTLTHSYTRFKRFKDHCHEHQNSSIGDKGHHGLCIYGLTTRVMKIMFDFYSDTFKPFMKKKQEGKLLATPMLMQAGSLDRIVVNDVVKEFCEDFVEICTYTVYEGSKHATYDEVDSIRTPSLAEMDLFMRNHNGDARSQNSLPAGGLFSFVSRADGAARDPVTAMLLLSLFFLSKE